MDADTFFATEWPPIVPRLRATLARAGVPARDREDLLQETAARLLAMWPSIDPDRPVEALARLIALNAWRDQWRHTGRRELVGEVPDAQTTDDTARTAMTRVEVRDVSRALRGLPGAAAQVLRDAAQAEWSGAQQATPASIRMARTRARRALVVLLQAAPAALGAFVAGMRRIGRHASAVTASVCLVGLAFVLALGRPGGVYGGAEPSEGQPNQVFSLGESSRSVSVAGREVGPLAKPVAKAPARKPTSGVPYYVVGVGQTTVATFADLNVAGAGVQVRQPSAKSSSPVCGRGMLVAPPALPACPS